MLDMLAFHSAVWVYGDYRLMMSSGSVDSYLSVTQLHYLGAYIIQLCVHTQEVFLIHAGSCPTCNKIN